VSDYVSVMLLLYPLIMFLSTFDDIKFRWFQSTTISGDIKLPLRTRPKICWGRRGRDRMVVGFTTTCVTSAYNHWSCEFELRSWRGLLNTTKYHLSVTYDRSVVFSAFFHQ